MTLNETYFLSVAWNTETDSYCIYLMKSEWGQNRKLGIVIAPSKELRVIREKKIKEIKGGTP